MVTFNEQKISLQKLEKVITEDGEREGYACKLSIRIDGMLPGILNNGQINGQIEPYEVSFTMNDNKIYGVKTQSLVVETQTNFGIEPVESVESGDVHKVQIESEYIFNEFCSVLFFFICRVICCLFINYES